MPSPPKPWERSAGAAAASAPPANIPSAPVASTSSTPASATSNIASIPDVPARPAALASQSTALSPYGASTSYGSPYNRMGSTYASPYGSTYGSGMGAYGGMGTYGGGYGSSYGVGSYGSGYGGYGGYGSGFGGGMSSMYGGMPGMYGMGGGMGMGPNGMPLTATLEASTQQTFGLLQSIVQTFTGMAQMLESTFMATHSSFFAMVGVVDQVGQLRNALGSILGLFGLVRWLRSTITGRPHGMQSEFRDFVNGRPVRSVEQRPPSKKPLIFFLLAIFGVPYAMAKLIAMLTARAQEQQQNAQIGPIDPTTLVFARAMYPFNPSGPGELALKVDEIVAVLARLDRTSGAEVPVSQADPNLGSDEEEWWFGRTRDGREGWVPRKWMELIRKSAEKTV